MKSMQYTAFAAFGLSAVAAVLFVAEWFVPFLAAAISLAVSGVLLLGFDRALVLLAEIRDAVCTVDAGEIDLPAPPSSKTPRSAAEIGADIRRMGSAKS